MIKSFPTYPSVSDIMKLGDNGIKALEEAVIRELKGIIIIIISLSSPSSSPSSSSSSPSSSSSLSEIEAKGPKKTVNIKVLAPHLRVDMNIIAKEDESIYDIALQNDDVKNLLECACNGIAACSTCHVYVDPDSYSKLNPIDESELDMLELAWGYDETKSRLGCQMILNKDVDSMIITIPSSSNNMH
jgi:2Fe-2S ferredoxin